jgi:hypothetical protein
MALGKLSIPTFRIVRGGTIDGKRPLKDYKVYTFGIGGVGVADRTKRYNATPLIVDPKEAVKNADSLIVFDTLENANARLQKNMCSTV